MGKGATSPPPPRNLLEALRLRALGLSAVPLCHPQHLGDYPPSHVGECARPGKSAPWKWGHYRDAPPAERQLHAWWGRNPHLNVGLLMGGPHRLVCLDDDGPGAAEYLAELCGGAIPVTVAWQSPGRGPHFLFRLPPNCALEKGAIAIHGRPLDLIGTRSLTVVPPSTHKSGGEYTWIGEPLTHLDQVAVLPAGVIDACRSSAPARPADYQRVDYGVGGAPDRQRVRAAADIAQWAPVVAGEGRHRRIFYLCCRLVHGYGLPVAVALDLLMRDWAGDCVPPYTADQLRVELEGALERGWHAPILDRERGKANHAAPCAPAPAPVAPVRQVIISDGAPPSDPSGYEPGNSRAPARGKGRLMSAVKRKPVVWLAEPWVARGKLTCIVGMPTCGKSTLGAWLCRHAGRAVVLPGGEDDVESMLVPRLEANGCDPNGILIADDRAWTLPLHKAQLLELCMEHRASLLWIDPLSQSYMGEISPNDAPGVRSVLEALVWLAQTAGIAVVYTRHPGKADSNLLPGSFEWKAVPRTVLQVVHDDGPPEQRVLMPWKDSLGADPPPTLFHLDGPPKLPKVFRWGEPVDRARVESMKGIQDAVDRWKLERAESLLGQLLAEGEMDVTAIWGHADREKIGDRHILRAFRTLGIVTREDGAARESRMYWRLPDRPIAATRTR